ncbi:MAG: hypothetical protein ACTHN8_06585 [Angustibacter sp.]
MAEELGAAGVLEVGEGEGDDGAGALVVAGLLGDVGRGVPVGVIRSVGSGDMEGSAGSGRVGRGEAALDTCVGAEGAAEEYGRPAGPGAPALAEAGDVGDVVGPADAAADGAGVSALGPLIVVEVAAVRSDQSGAEPVGGGGADRAFGPERPATIQPVRRVTSSTAPSTAGVATSMRRRR